MSDVSEYMENARRAVSSVETESVEKAAELCIRTVRAGGTIYLCGNGGSAVDAQHIAGELVGRFRLERRGIPAVALTSNSAVITAIANDYDFDDIFSRQVEALGRPGDLLMAITTSGSSPNVLKAVEKALENDMSVIGLTGGRENPVAAKSTVSVMVDASDTSHIQEALLVAGHAICHAIEKAVSSKPGN